MFLFFANCFHYARLGKNFKLLVVYISGRYHKIMVQLRLLLILVRPSWLSFALTTLATAGIIAFTNWSFLAASPVLFDAFYGEHGIVTTLERSPNALAAMQEGFASNSALYYSGLFAVAVVAATTVFITLRSIEHGFGAIRTMRESTPTERHEQWQHALVRTAVLVLWAMYALFTVQYAAPFCLLLWRIGIEEIGGFWGVLGSLLVALLLFGVLHLHIIFARLLCLRPRVFGSDVIVESVLIR